MLWNLSSLADLQQTVTERVRSGSGETRREKRAAQFRVSVVAAIVATTISLGPIIGSGGLSVIPSPAVAVSGTIAQQPDRPLAHLFDSKVGDDWSHEIEMELLEKIAQKWGPASVSSNADFTDAIYGNQQDSLSDRMPRLSREQIRSAVKRRRSA